MARLQPRAGNYCSALQTPPSEPRVKRPKAARTSGSNAATLKQGFPSRSREGPNRVPLARMGIAATGRTFRAASGAAEGRGNERPSQRIRLGVTKSAWRRSGHVEHCGRPLTLAVVLTNAGPVRGSDCASQRISKRLQSREYSGRRPARTSGPNAATLKQRFPSRSREGPNRVPFARAGIAATCPTFRAASGAAEGPRERAVRTRPP